jgi:hypothetical protein
MGNCKREKKLSAIEAAVELSPKDGAEEGQDQFVSVDSLTTGKLQKREKFVS